MKRIKDERAEVMIEGMIVMIITMFMLLWILAIGFMYYQRYTMTIVTNDAAAKIAATYHNPSSDIVLGYMKAENLSDRDLYRGYAENALKHVNEMKAQNYVSYVLKKTNFNGVIKDVNVKLELVQDSAFRKHVKLETACTFKTPFGEALDLFGMEGTTTYYAEARADCTDVMDYISTVDFANHFLDKALDGKVVSLINELIKVFNRNYSGSGGSGGSGGGGGASWGGGGGGGASGGGFR